ncbi:hypothetical protein BD626DRAFT_583005 [Schizophyllum amplum]|uniref:Uncharacterized protein n=1 Tax=Schizophyllum amplum TaxID=97359 RepID=A0A550CI42_9AGAR|nr:hypothetical protein BD626DRAFT_583005 [Auriculariopsis ampla]
MFSGNMNGSHGYYKYANGAEVVYSSGTRRNHFAHSKYIPNRMSWHSAPSASTHQSSSIPRHNNVTTRKYKKPPRYHPLLKPKLEMKRRRATTSYELGPTHVSRGLQSSQRRGPDCSSTTSSPPADVEFETARQLWDAVKRNPSDSIRDIALRFVERADDWPDDRPHSLRLPVMDPSGSDLWARTGVRRFGVFGYPTKEDSRELARLFHHVQLRGLQSIRIELDDGTNYTSNIEYLFLSHFLIHSISTLTHVSLTIPLYNAELPAIIVDRLPCLNSLIIQAQDDINIATPLLKVLDHQSERAKALSYLEVTCQGVSYRELVRVMMGRWKAGLSPPKGQTMTVLVRSRDTKDEKRPRSVTKLQEKLATLGISIHYNEDMMCA